MPDHHSLSPRARAVLTRIESWLLALEYAWARHALGLLGHGLARAKQALFPREGSRTRKLVGLVATAGFVVATTVLTSAVTALIGTQALA